MLIRRFCSDGSDPDFFHFIPVVALTRLQARPRLMTRSALPRTPASMGFRMPAEWEPHEATWLAWPHERTDWPSKFGPIPWAYAEIVRHLASVERVRLIVQNHGEEDNVRKILRRAGTNIDAVEFFRIRTDRGWMRDSGPIFVRGSDGAIGATLWRFNAWAKYDNWKKDAAISNHLKFRGDVPVWRPVHGDRRIVLEGGSIDVNGRGTLLTTEECLLSPIQARNPGLNREDIEKIFANYLGISRVLWLGRGISGDDTHGHIDDLARFVNATTVVTVISEDASDDDFEPLQDNFARLRTMLDQDGKPLRVVTLPMPSPVYFDGQRLPASYANFYVANGLVLVPTFNDPKDRVALNTLAEVFPDRAVVGIACRDLVLGLGTLHCLTQQQPAGSSPVFVARSRER